MRFICNCGNKNEILYCKSGQMLTGDVERTYVKYYDKRQTTKLDGFYCSKCEQLIAHELLNFVNVLKGKKLCGVC
jgi:hypothetical protein